MFQTRQTGSHEHCGEMFKYSSNLSTRCFLSIVFLLVVHLSTTGGFSLRDRVHNTSPILSISGTKKVQAGDNVRLHCRVKFTDVILQTKPTVQWVYTEFNGMEEEVLSNLEVLPDAAETVYDGEGELSTVDRTADNNVFDAFLNLNRVEKEQRGIYECLVILDDAVFAKEAILTVKSRKVEESRQKFIMERTGGNITLDCLDMKNKKEGNISGVTVWRKNGETIVVNGTNLKLIRVDKEDSGEYHCLVSGKFAKNFTLQVKHAPVIKTQTFSVKQHPGYPASLTCTVSSMPVPLIRWYHLSNSSSASKLVEYSSTVSIDLVGFKDGMMTSILKLHNVSLENYGKYACNASNELGETSKLYQLEYSPVPVLEFSSGRMNKPVFMLLTLVYLAVR